MEVGPSCLKWKNILLVGDLIYEQLPFIDRSPHAKANANQLACVTSFNYHTVPTVTTASIRTAAMTVL